MSLAAVQQYIKSNLDGIGWPFGGVENLACYIQPPNPNVQSEIPTAYVWMQRDRETRDTDRLKTGTIPRAATPGGASGAKAVTFPVDVSVGTARFDADELIGVGVDFVAHFFARQEGH